MDVLVLVTSTPFLGVSANGKPSRRTHSGGVRNTGSNPVRSISLEEVYMGRRRRHGSRARSVRYLNNFTRTPDEKWGDVLYLFVTLMILGVVVFCMSFLEGGEILRWMSGVIWGTTLFMGIPSLFSYLKDKKEYSEREARLLADRMVDGSGL